MFVCRTCLDVVHVCMYVYMFVLCVRVHVCTCLYVVHVCVYVHVYTLGMGIILFNAQRAHVSFSTAVHHATTISIKKSVTSNVWMLSGFSFFSSVVRLRPIFGNVPLV